MAHPTTPFESSPASSLAFQDAQRLCFDAHPGVVLALDTEGRIRFLNPAGAKRLGYDPDELVGQSLTGHLVTLEELGRHATQLSDEWGEQVAADVNVFSARLRRDADRPSSETPGRSQEWVLRHKGGFPHPTQLAMAALRGPQGEVTGFVAVEALEVKHSAFPQLAHHDNLTGLPTRAVLSDRAEMAIQRSSRQQSVVAMMLIEIVGFDALCEEQGHSVGDDVLRATAGRLHFELRKTDTAVHLDGGQFAAMLVDLHHADEARTIADKIQRALSAKVNVGVGILPLNVRIGVAWFPSHGDQLLPLLEAAEAALSSLKNGETGVAIASSSLEAA